MFGSFYIPPVPSNSPCRSVGSKRSAPVIGPARAGCAAHLTGALAVCAGSCGPGNLHLINGLFDCHRSGVPVLAIAAHIPSTEIGIDYFQATHPESLFKDCSHYVELVSNPDQLPQILARAIRT